MNEQQQKLTAYIQQQLQSGQSPNDIAIQLRTANWPETDIQQAFYAVQNMILPTGFTPANAPQETVVATNPAATVGKPQSTGRRRGRLRTGWQLFKQSMTILRGNRYLLRYLYMTATWIFSITIIFIGIFYIFSDTLFGNYGNQDNLKILGYIISFIDYVLVYFFINIYAAGLTANVLDIFQGNKKSYHDYMDLAWSKKWPIFYFSVIAATVGFILHYIVERIKFVGWLVSWILGTLWSLGTLFVIPIIMTNDHPNAPKSIKQSVSFFKETWGENITAKISVNAPLFVLNCLLVLVFLLALIFIVPTAGFVAFWIIFAVFLILAVAIAIVGSFANSLVNIALFYFAAYQKVPPAFSEELLNQVFIKRKRRFFRKTKDETAA